MGIKILNKIDPNVEYYTVPFKKASKNYGQSQWLARFMRSKHYKNLEIDGMPVNPRLAFEVIRQYWMAFYRYLEYGNTVTVEWLGRFSIVREYNEEKGFMMKRFFWFKKPHPYVELSASQHYYKEHIK